MRLDVTTKEQRSSFWLDTVWKPQEFRLEIMHSGVVEETSQGTGVDRYAKVDDAEEGGVASGGL